MEIRKRISYPSGNSSSSSSTEEFPNREIRDHDEDGDDNLAAADVRQKRTFRGNDKRQPTEVQVRTKHREGEEQHQEQHRQCMDFIIIITIISIQLHLLLFHCSVLVN